MQPENELTPPQPQGITIPVEKQFAIRQFALLVDNLTDIEEVRQKAKDVYIQMAMKDALMVHWMKTSVNDMYQSGDNAA